MCILDIQFTHHTIKLRQYLANLYLHDSYLFILKYLIKLLLINIITMKKILYF